jgi:hypothetical protein
MYGRSIAVGVAALAAAFAGTISSPADVMATNEVVLASHDGDHRPRPTPPSSPRGQDRAANEPAEQANADDVQTGPGNSITHGNNPND